MQLRKAKTKPQSELYDLWETRKEHKNKKDSITKTINKLHPSSKRNKKAALPHPGQSYNPDPEEHRKLLLKVAKKEIEHQKKHKSINKAIKVKVDASEVKKSEKDDFEAGIKHLITKETEEDEHGSSSSTDEAFSDYDEKDFQAIMKDKKVVEKRKSRQQRLRQLKDRLQRKAAKLRKLKNIRLSKFDAIKKMIKELDKKQKEEEEKRRKSRKKRNKIERFGQKFEPSDPIYCLSEDLPSSLRQTTCPLNAIVREQLENFQSRLMIEPTSIQTKKRKYKKKQFERLTAAEQEDDLREESESI